MAEFQDYAGLLAVTEALKSAGIPFEGLSVTPAPPGTTPDWINAAGALKISVNFLSTATQRQRNDAAAIVLATAKANRATKTNPKLRGDIDGLSSVQQKALLNELLVEKLKTDPQFAARINVPLEGDEPVNAIKTAGGK